MVRCRLVAVWWMANMRSFCFSIAFHNFATLENQLTYQCPSSWPVVITMKKKLASTSKKMLDIGRSKWMATSLQLVESWKKTVEVVRGRILAGWAQKSPESRTLLPIHACLFWGGLSGACLPVSQLITTNLETNKARDSLQCLNCCCKSVSGEDFGA